MDKILAAAFSLTLTISSHTAVAETNEDQLLVASVDWSRDFFLCRSDHNGSVQTYSCRDYRENDISYRLFYKGGTVPKAVARIDGHLPNESLNHYNLEKLTLPVYQIAPPAGVPASAKFLGTGVCRDEIGNTLACGVFEHLPARESHKFHYMVLYQDIGDGPRKISRMVAGPNPDAIPAEFAYQTGLGLINKTCCHREGMAYLELAHRLFPDFAPYRNAYLQHRDQGTSLKVAENAR